MSTNRKFGLTRRDFLKKSAAAAVIAGISPSLGKAVIGIKPQKSQVVLIRDEKALTVEGKPNGEVLPGMLDEAMTVLFGKDNALDAWKEIAEPNNTVGIKTNIWRYLRTPLALERHIEKRMVDCGVLADRIAADDRGVLHNSVFKNADKLINIRPLRSHHWSGVGGCIKNMIMFDPSPPKYHPDSCASLAELYDLPLIKGKTKLHVLVMLTPLFHGKGPHHFQKSYTWEYKGMIVSKDPVAADAVGVKILEAKRKEYFGKDEPFTVSPKHIRMADEKYGLGNANFSNIELVKLGYEEGRFI